MITTAVQIDTVLNARQLLPRPTYGPDPRGGGDSGR